MHKNYRYLQEEIISLSDEFKTADLATCKYFEMNDIIFIVSM